MDPDRRRFANSCFCGRCGTRYDENLVKLWSFLISGREYQDLGVGSVGYLEPERHRRAIWSGARNDSVTE
jgi:hypothetical protein